MVTARQIAQTVVTVLLFVILISVVIFLLTGCLTLTRNAEQDTRQISIAADCDENTLDIQLDADATTDVEGANITK